LYFSFSLKLHDWTLQDSTFRDKIAEVDIAGLDIYRHIRGYGHCRTGRLFTGQ